jgi:hypothetical protein
MSRPYDVPYLLNGRVYTRHFAWFPTKTSEGSWIWLVDYYTRDSRHGRKIMDLFSYQTDSNYY